VAPKLLTDAAAAGPGPRGGSIRARVGLAAAPATVPAGAALAGAGPQEVAVIDIGSRLEPFVDDELIAEMTGVALRLHHPTPREVVLAFDAPWEGPISGYVTVFKDDDRFRMYYRGWQDQDDRDDVTCYAESPDGIEWTKPSLGLFEVKGTSENNVIWTGEGTHNFAPFKDANPDAPDSQRYKALAYGPLLAFASPDGIHWEKMRDKPVITEGAFDSQNLAFWDADQDRYVAYLRGFVDGIRTIGRATSRDFLKWTGTTWLDFGDAPAEHLYTNAITPYFRAPHIHLGFPKRFVPDRKAVPHWPHPGVSDGLFMSSRDGLHWRRAPEAFLPPGPDPDNWTERNMMIAAGILPTAPGELSIYWIEHYRHATARLRRGTLRTDGFVSLHADGAGGEVVTDPLVFEGRELVINYATSAAGSVRVEIQNGGGAPVAGRTLDDCPPIYGDEIERVVAWKDGSDVGAEQERAIRLRFALKDADLFAIRFRP